MTEQHYGDVDGVRAVVCDVPGPMRAGLIVRVGMADEDLAHAGITHLLEHLALFGIGRPGDHSNAYVDQTVMHFHCVGEDVVPGFLTDVTRQLADPPVARIGEERGVLRAESAGRRSSAEDLLLAWRYGARSYGLVGQQQLGIEYLGADAVRNWSSRFVTKGNSVLWASKPLPPGLRIALPDGPPVPPRDPHEHLVPRVPAKFAARESAGIAVHTLLARSEAATAYADVLRRRLVDTLRVRAALAYSPMTDYRPLNRDVAQVIALSDLVDGHQTDATRLFLGVLTDLAGARPPTAAELTEWLADVQSQEQAPAVDIAFTMAQAWNCLLGAPTQTRAELAANRRAVRAEDLVGIAQTAANAAVAMLPNGVRQVRGDWAMIPSTLYDPVAGEVFEHADAPDNAEQLVVSAAGVTWRSGEHHITVPLGHAVALQHWPDGRRVIIADDANRIVVEPTMWRDGGRLLAHLDRLYPPGIGVPMPTRPPTDIPVPRALRR